jgi:arsenate reductase
MAEGFLRSFNPKLQLYSAGTEPAKRVNPNAVMVMKEIDIDISAGQPNLVDDYLAEAFDYVITVCDHAKEVCPVFMGEVQHRLHIGFDDPAEAVGTAEEVLAVYRRIRDEIQKDFTKFFKINIMN